MTSLEQGTSDLCSAARGASDVVSSSGSDKIYKEDVQQCKPCNNSDVSSKALTNDSSAQFSTPQLSE